MQCLSFSIRFELTSFVRADPPSRVPRLIPTFARQNLGMSRHSQPQWSVAIFATETEMARPKNAAPTLATMVKTARVKMQWRNRLGGSVQKITFPHFLTDVETRDFRGKGGYGATFQTKETTPRDLCDRDWDGRLLGPRKNLEAFTTNVRLMQLRKRLKSKSNGATKMCHYQTFATKKAASNCKNPGTAHAAIYGVMRTRRDFRGKGG